MIVPKTNLVGQWVLTGVPKRSVGEGRLAGAEMTQIRGYITPNTSDDSQKPQPWSSLYNLEAAQGLPIWSLVSESPPPVSNFLLQQTCRGNPHDSARLVTLFTSCVSCAHTSSWRECLDAGETATQ